jgi:hypothetical protein
MNGGRLRLVCLASILLFLIACGEDRAVSDDSVASLTVYKTPSCACCSAWVDHVQAHSFSADVVNQDSIAHIKDFYQLPVNARSCHTAVSENGYVFEGHVPARYMKQFLAEPVPGSKGLVVPAMPLGSPGMEYKQQFNAYQIYALLEDGSLSVYAKVDRYEQQFD